MPPIPVQPESAAVVLIVNGGDGIVRVPVAKVCGAAIVPAPASPAVLPEADPEVRTSVTDKLPNFIVLFVAVDRSKVSSFFRAFCLSFKPCT